MVIAYWSNSCSILCKSYLAMPTSTPMFLLGGVNSNLVQEQRRVPRPLRAFKGMSVASERPHPFSQHKHVLLASLNFVTSGKLHLASMTQGLFPISIFCILTSPGQDRSSVRPLFFQNCKKHCQTLLEI